MSGGKKKILTPTSAGGDIYQASANSPAESCIALSTGFGHVLCDQLGDVEENVLQLWFW